MRKQLTVAVALLACLQVAQAADETGKEYFNLQGGYLWGDNDRHIDDDSYFGIGIGSHVSNDWTVEFNLNGRNFDADFGGKWDITAATVNVLRVFNRAGAFSPYVGLGVGYIGDDLNPGPREGSPLGEVGLGAFIDVASNASDSFLFQLRPEVKARWDFIDKYGEKRFLDYYAGLGLQFNFGEPRHVEPPPPPPAPAAAPTPPPPPPPPPPADTDGDGVLDPADRCPDTPHGVAVDAVGCPRKETVTLQGVSFETDSADLTAESRPVLDEMASDLKKHPRFKIELQGHTDSRGSNAYNLKLSDRRAQSVRDYLVSQGVSPTQLVSRGYGETQPKASNDTADGRAENRRVDVKVLDNPGDVEVKGGE